MQLTIITFMWGRDFAAHHVNALWWMCKDHIKVPHRFVCITDKPEGLKCEHYPLWEDLMTFPGRPGNFRRLRAFDRTFQQSLGSRIVMLDLDTIILSDITDLVTGGEDFRIMEGSLGRTGERLNKYNGSFWVCEAGARHHLWEEFGPHAEWELNACRLPSGRPIVGSDQAWIAMKSPEEQVFTREEGLWQYFHIRPVLGYIPQGTRVVFFAGRDNPWGDRVRRTHRYLADAWRRAAMKGNEET